MRESRAALAVTERHLGPRDFQIIILFMTGQFSPAELAKQFDIGASEVEAIVKHPEAKEFKQGALERVKSELFAEDSDAMSNLQYLALGAIKRTLAADISPKHGGKSNQDKVALEILKATGVIKPQNEKDGNALMLTNQQFDNLFGALDKSDKALGAGSPDDGAEDGEE